MTGRSLSRVAATVAVLLSLTVASASAGKTQPHHGNRPGARKSTSRLVTINVDLDFKPHKRSNFGKVLGYDPAEAHVRMGDRIQFVNTDDETHTATGMSYTGQTAPAHYRYNGDPTTRSGRLINASEWSAGNLRAHGGKSQIFVAKNVGHYFYGCSYHLGVGQIGVIEVGP